MTEREVAWVLCLSCNTRVEAEWLEWHVVEDCDHSALMVEPVDG
jgi:hypothetical protein